AIARPTARTSVWRSESQTNTALIASESTVRAKSFKARIGAPCVTRAEGGGLLFGVFVALLRRRVRRRAGHPVGPREPAREIERTAARGAEGECRVLFARLHLRATARTSVHACLVRWVPVRFNNG